MAQWSLQYAKIDEESAYQMTISNKGNMRTLSIIVVAVFIILGLIGFGIGLIGEDTCATVGSALLCLLPTLLLTMLVPYTSIFHIDSSTRTITLTKKYFLGFGPWPRERVKSLAFSDIDNIAFKSQWLGGAYFVQIQYRGRDRIMLLFGRDEVNGRRATERINSIVGGDFGRLPAVEDVPEVPDVPVTTWRMGIASIYGFSVAIALGFLWSLIVSATSMKYGYVSLLMGLIIGFVVSFFSGGSRDIRYAAIGAVLSGVSIAFGEILIFGLPESQFIYQFDFMDFIIYGLALVEGWEIPRRSIPFIRRQSHLIHEENRTPVLGFGVALLFVVMAISLYFGWVPTPEGTQAKVHFDRGSRLAQEGDFDSAIGEYQEAIRIKPDYAMAYNDLGWCYYNIGRLNDAESAFKEAIKFDSQLALAHVNLANLYNDLGRFQEGLETINRAIELDSSRPDAHLVAGYIYMNTGRLAEAQEALETTINLDSSYAEAFFWLGVTHIESGNWGVAHENFTKAIDIGGPPDAMSVSYAYRGLANGVLGDYDAALVDAEEAINLYELNAFAFYVRGLVNVDLGNTDLAIADLETALSLGLEYEARDVAESILAELNK